MNAANNLALDFSTAYSEAHSLHVNNHGFFSVLRKGVIDQPNQSSYPMSHLKSIMDSIESSPDAYVSQCSFTHRTRRTAHINNIGCSFVDIDCYKFGIDATDEFVSKLLDRASFAGLPLPTGVFYSGRGIYLKWLYTQSIKGSELCRWNALQKILISLYQSIGADVAVKDCARVLRIMGSVNSKVSTSGADSAGSDLSAVVRQAWSHKIRYDFNLLFKDAASIDLESYAHNAPASLLRASTGTTACSESSVQDLNPIDLARRHKARVKRIQQGLEPGQSIPISDEQARTIAHLNAYAKKYTREIDLDNSQESQQGPRAQACTTDASERRKSTRRSASEMNWKRFIDLRDLSVMREGVHSGSRDMTLFWMGVFLGHSGIINPANFHDEMSHLASGFPGSDFKPMQDDSMVSLMHKVEAMARGEKVIFNGNTYCSLYTPTNDYLINAFEISSDEQMRLSTIIDDGEKLRRADQRVPGRSDRRAHRVQWRTQATNLAKEAIAIGQVPSISSIARTVGMHKAQVSRLLSSAKKITTLENIAAGKKASKDSLHKRNLIEQATQPLGCVSKPTEKGLRLVPFDLTAVASQTHVNDANGEGLCASGIDPLKASEHQVSLNANAAVQRKGMHLRVVRPLVRVVNEESAVLDSLDTGTVAIFTVSRGGEKAAEINPLEKSIDVAALAASSQARAIPDSDSEKGTVAIFTVSRGGDEFGVNALRDLEGEGGVAAKKLNELNPAMGEGEVMLRNYYDDLKVKNTDARFRFAQKRVNPGATTQGEEDTEYGSPGGDKEAGSLVREVVRAVKRSDVLRQQWAGLQAQGKKQAIAPKHIPGLRISADGSHPSLSTSMGLAGVDLMRYGEFDVAIGGAVPAYEQEAILRMAASIPTMPEKRDMALMSTSERSAYQESINDYYRARSDAEKQLRAEWIALVSEKKRQRLQSMAETVEKCRLLQANQLAREKNV